MTAQQMPVGTDARKVMPSVVSINVEGKAPHGEYAAQPQFPAVLGDDPLPCRDGSPFQNFSVLPWRR